MGVSEGFRINLSVTLLAGFKHNAKDTSNHDFVVHIVYTMLEVSFPYCISISDGDRSLLCACT